MNNAIKTYITELNKQYSSGVAHEHAYRGTLQNLLSAMLPKCYTIVNEPTCEKCGKPDYIILKDKTPVAYIEAKDLLDNDLDGRKENKEQFDRYKSSLDHIIFTNYLDFHLYENENKECVDAVRLADVRGDKIVLNEECVDKFSQLVDRVAKATPQRIISSKRLASMMAGKARMLANVIEQALKNDKEQTSELANQMKVFQEFLIHDLTEKTFADIYAQTIAYGLFTARLNDPTPEDFSRNEANELIPKSNPFLRRIFNDIAGFNVDGHIAWIIDDLVEVFRVTDMSKVMKDFGGTSGRTDPIMHFYEVFLGEYDPSLKKSRGVFYTPQPVVDFIVRAVDDILKRDFGLPMGLADSSMIKHEVVNDQYVKAKKGTKEPPKTILKPMHRVQILDPATGTGTFLAAVIRQIYASMDGQQGAWNDYVEEHLLTRLNGFELMMASYTIAHLKLNMVLKETGYTQQSDQRLHVYLTNSLEEYNADTGTLFAAAISQESHEASRIKRDAPVMVMIGNPPYSGVSNNNGTWITQLIKDYKKEPGGKIKLQERKNWLNDDYVKFIRLAQDYVSRNGTGIIGFINNNAFADNVTFRGMRWQLLHTFDKIYIVNLHGSHQIGHTDKCPNGNPDENVFDITIGVSINVFVKTGKKNDDELGQVFYSEIFGGRQLKYDWLNDTVLEKIDFQEIHPTAPNYFFVAKNNDGKSQYDKGFKITEIMPESVSGIVTMGDGFAISSTKEELKKRLEYIKNNDIPISQLNEEFALGKNYADFILSHIKKMPIEEKLFVPVHFRPFDNRVTYYSENVIWRPRKKVMSNMLHNNIGIVVSRQCSDDWKHVFITNRIADFNLTGTAGRFGSGYVFPLYIYRDSFEGEERIPNINTEIARQIMQILGEQINPQELFDYIYAVLYSPTYRSKNNEFLKIDFPRIPYPENPERYHRLATIGGQLRKLHLMEEVPNIKHAQYNNPGENLVDKSEYKEGSVWINKEQCFSDVPETAWTFYIGGYQPAQKWLKDRRGRKLSFDDITHYRRIITVLLETDRLMKLVDKE